MQAYLYTASLRCYAELNDFLSKERQYKAFSYSFFGKPTVKDLIESVGVPHTEIDLILLNGKSVDFSAHVHDKDQIAVYPCFESLDITPLLHLRPNPLRVTCFVADVHLGKLARYLRMLGFDTLYHPYLRDEEIILRGEREKRIILTRDIGILKNSRVTHGYFIRNVIPKKQLREVVQRFALEGQIAPFTRCMECNVPLQLVEKSAVQARLPPLTEHYFNTFFYCPSCHRIYWEGSHYEKMLKLIHFISSL